MALAAVQTNSGVATTGDVSSSSWTPTNGNLLIAAVITRATTIDATVSGNGQTWTAAPNGSKVGDRGQDRLQVFYCVASSPSAGAVTAALSGNTLAAVLLLFEISGADSTTPIEADANAGTGGSDNSSPSASVTTLTDSAWAVGIFDQRNRTITLDASLTSDIEDIQGGTGGNMVGGTIAHKAVSPAGSATVSGTLSATADWAVWAGSIKPAGAGGTTFTESPAVSVTFGVSTTKRVSAAKSLTTTFSVAPRKAVSLAKSLTATFSAAPSKAVSLARSIATTFGVSSSNGLVKLISATIGVTFTPSAARSIAYRLSSSIGVTFSVAPARLISLGRSVAVTFSPAAAKMVALSRSLTTTFTVSRGWAVSLMRSISTTFAVSATNGLAFLHTATISVTFSVAAATARRFRQAASIASSLAVTASNTLTEGGGPGATLSDWFARLGLLRK